MPPIAARRSPAAAWLLAVALALTLTLLVACQPATASAGTLAATPYMGWDTYFALGGNYSEATILQEASEMISRGLEQHGYRYMWLDVGWWHGERNAASDARPLAPEPHCGPPAVTVTAAYPHGRSLHRSACRRLCNVRHPAAQPAAGALDGDEQDRLSPYANGRGLPRNPALPSQVSHLFDQYRPSPNGSCLRAVSRSRACLR